MKSLRVYWCAGRPNFGDSVTPLLLKCLVGRDIVWTDKWHTEALTIGSLLGWAVLKEGRDGFAGWLRGERMKLRRLLSGPVAVCGTGFLSDPFLSPHAPLLRRTPKVFAVRGELTRAALVRLGALSGDVSVPLGDPGILFGDLWPQIRRSGAARDRAYVPHESEWGGDRLRSFMESHPVIRVIDVRKPADQVFSALAECAEVFSSSLHGLIASDALGIPNRWVRLDIPGHDDADNRFKFDDYYSAYGVSRNPISLAEVPDAAVGEQVPRDALERVQNEMRTAFGKLRSYLNR